MDETSRHTLRDLLDDGYIPITPELLLKRESEDTFSVRIAVGQNPEIVKTREFWEEKAKQLAIIIFMLREEMSGPPSDN